MSLEIRNALEDELFAEAAKFVLKIHKGSISELQRQFSIGYYRAVRLIEEFEKQGIVGSLNGSEPREVLVTNNELERILNKLNK